MACQTDNCWGSFTDLCAFALQPCVRIDQVIPALIENQYQMANSIAPVISGAEAITNCDPVYFDTTTGLVSATPSADTIPLGISVGEGRVLLNGKSACVTPVCAVGDPLPSAGSYLDVDLNKLDSSAGGYWVLLEDSTSSGCTLAMQVGQVQCFWEQYIDNGYVVPLGGTQPTPREITVPFDGAYYISMGLGLDADVPGCVESGIIVNGTINPTLDQFGSTVDPNCSYVARSSFIGELQAGDTLGQYIEAIGANLAINASGLQVYYLGNCQVTVL